MRADTRLAVSSHVRRERRFRLSHADSVGRCQVGSGYRVGLQAGGHRFDPGTLHKERPRKSGPFLCVSGSEEMLTAEPKEAHPLAEPEADQDRAGPHRWTPKTAREAARLSRESRASRRRVEPPSDADIERGLRERAVSDPRAAEILLRWLQRPRAGERVAGDDLDSRARAVTPRPAEARDLA
jgi:hypothetical protein